MQTNMLLSPTAKTCRLFQSCNVVATGFPYNIFVDSGTTEESPNMLPVMGSIYININPSETKTITHDALNGRTVVPSIHCLSPLDDTITSSMMYYDPENVTNTAFQYTTDMGTFYNNNTNTSVGVWYGLQSSTPITVTHIGIVDSTDNTDLFARSFAFETSDDGQAWTRRYTHENHVYTSVFTGIRLEEPVEAQYFRFYCLDGADPMFWELTRILLFDINEPITYKMVASEVSITSISDTESDITNNSIDTPYIVKVDIM